MGCTKARDSPPHVPPNAPSHQTRDEPVPMRDPMSGVHASALCEGTTQTHVASQRAMTKNQPTTAQWRFSALWRYLSSWPVFTTYAASADVNVDVCVLDPRTWCLVCALTIRFRVLRPVWTRSHRLFRWASERGNSAGGAGRLAGLRSLAYWSAVRFAAPPRLRAVPWRRLLCPE